MARWVGTYSGFLAACVLGAAAMMLTMQSAHAQSHTCATVGTNPNLNGSYPEGESFPVNPTATHDVQLVIGDTLVFVWVNASFPFFEVDGTVLEIGNASATSGSAAHVATTAGVVPVRASAIGGPGGGSHTVTCTSAGGGGGSPPPLTDAELAAATRDALAQGIMNARPNPNPTGLPGSAPSLGLLEDDVFSSFGPGANGPQDVQAGPAVDLDVAVVLFSLPTLALDETLPPGSEEAGPTPTSPGGRADATSDGGDRCAAARKTLADARSKQATVEGRLREAEDQAATSLAIAKAELAAGKIDEGEYRQILGREIVRLGIGALQEELAEAGAAVRAAESELANCLGVSLSVVVQDGPDGDDPVELGDGEPILYFPQAGSNVPWPTGNRLDTGSDRFFEIDGMPANFWTRVNGTVLGGAMGRQGFAGSLQAGLTVGVTPDIDLGVYAYLLSGKISSTPLSGELQTLAAALGAYVKTKLNRGLSLGLSASQELGANDITISGATGSYLSSLTTLDASVGLAPIRLDSLILSPSAALSWKHTINGAYTDSTGLAVPQTTDSTLAATGVLDIARPMAIDHPVIATVTPRVTLAGNFFVKPAASLALTPGTLETSRFTVDASAGVALGLVEGGTVNFAASANGLLGNTTAYSFRVGMSVPLN